MEAAEKAAEATGNDRAAALPMDISDENSVEAAYTAITSGGPLDIVVANAGGQLLGQDAK